MTVTVTVTALVFCRPWVIFTITTPAANSEHWFTTSFLWRKVPEGDARIVPPQ